MASSTPRVARPGRNCWRIAPASRVAFLIDPQNYYCALADSFARAERSIAIVGWDVNSRTRMIEEGGSEALPRELGPMLDALVKRKPRLHAWVLEWDFPMLYALDREWLPLIRFGWQTHRRVHFRLDANHPLGASQHQKIVVVDDAVAFVGGMDVTHGRWDTCEHRADDPRRSDPWGRPYPPYHDVQLACDGAAAAALAQLARERWQRAGGRLRRPVRAHGDPWPPCVKPDLENAELAIARTDPPYDGRTAVREVLHAWLDLIGTAKRSVYIENQYLTSAAVGDALAERLGSSDCPEVVIVITHGCSGWLEEATMGVLRARLLERLKAADRCNRLRIYYVCAGAGVDVKIHSKVMIIDDQIARIGSANLNNRSMGLDTECDVFIEARGRPDVQDAILALRDRLLGEHLGVAPIEVRDAVARHGSLGAAIEALRGGAHTLVPLEVDRDSWIDLVIPDGTLTDPEQPVSMTDLVGQLAPDDLTPLRGPLEWAAIVAVATAIAAGICYATPLSAQVAAFGVDAGLAPWRDGPLAPVVASGAVAIGALSLAPVTLLIALCGFVLGPWMGFVTALCGAALAAFAGYAIGARLPRDAAERLVGQRIAELSRRVRSGGARAVFVVRLFPSASFGAVNLFAGAARYSLRDFWFGTLCAIAPAALALAMLGHAAALAVARHGSAALAGATALALAAMAALLAIRSQIRARAVGRGSMA